MDAPHPGQPDYLRQPPPLPPQYASGPTGPVPVPPRTQPYPTDGHPHGPYAYAAGAHPYGQQPGVQVSAKNPAVSVLLSFLLPGLGQLVNGETVKGLVMLGAYSAAWFLFWMTVWFLIGFVFAPVVFATWVWSMVDANAGAHRWNREHGILS